MSLILLDSFNKIYTLTGHFIRYTLLVPGWTSFCLQHCLNSSWHRFNKVFVACSCGSVVEHCIMSANVVGSIPREHTYWQYKCIAWMHCKSLWIKASAKCINVNVFETFLRDFGSLLDWDLVTGGHLSKVNSLSCSRNQYEIIWALWHVHYPAGSSIRRCVHCSHKGMDMVSNNTQVGCGV